MEVTVEEVQVAKYPAYKDSGVEWLGEIPAHWKLEKGKWLFEKQDRPVREDDGIVTAFRDGQVTLRSNRREEGFTNAIQEHGYQGIRKGDLVIHAMDAFAGAIGISDSDGKSSPVYAVCTPKAGVGVYPYFYAYFLRNLAKTGFIESLAKGIRERSTDFRFKDFGLLSLPVPPKEEQTTIAQFLDRKTAQIDKAIGIKEKQIELLKERRQILIHNAVTRGLNPDAPMKDSGVEWIGKIPAHWGVKRLKFVAKLIAIKVPSKGNQLNYIGMENIESWTGRYVVTESETEGIASYFEEGDILFGKLRPYLAKVHLAKEEGICSTEFLIYRAGKEIFNWYLHQLMLSFEFINLVDSSTYGSKMPRANSDFIGNQLIPIPLKGEQKEISEHIAAVSTKISIAISTKEKEIEKLKEYKASLINSSVTGKIKVYKGD